MKYVIGIHIIVMWASTLYLAYLNGKIKGMKETREIFTKDWK